MNSSFDSDSGTNSKVGGTPARRPQWDRRSSRRCKIIQPIRIRPTDPRLEPFDDIRSTLSVSPTGVYFRSSETKYEVGMRLLVSLPYSNEPEDMPHEYLTQVVRVASLPNGSFGIGMRILREMNLQGK
ncbi:MAG: PilZ domain-containing protein [Candidatus Acidiferrales bacterium]